MKEISDEKKEKIITALIWFIPFIIIGIIAIIVISVRTSNMREEEKSPITEKTTEEAPMEFSESVNNAVLYVDCAEGDVILKTQDFEPFKGCKVTVNENKFRNEGGKEIITSLVGNKTDIDGFYSASYSIYADNLDNCMFRIIPQKKKVEINKFQTLGIDYEKVQMFVKTECCDEIDIKYKKSIYIANQSGMFTINLILNDQKDIDRLGFSDIKITARMVPYGEDIGDKKANINCYITQKGFEFYSDIPLSKVIVSRNTTSVNKWDDMRFQNIQNFIYDGKEFTFENKENNQDQEE